MDSAKLRPFPRTVVGLTPISGAVCRKLAVCPRLCPTGHATCGVSPKTVKHASRIASLLSRRYLLKVRKMSPGTPLFILALAVTSVALAQQAPPVTWIHSSPPAHMIPIPDRNPTVPLWSNGAPGSEGKTSDEKYRIVGDLLVVSGVNCPSITLYLPAREKATGAAIIVAPGGSFREIWITHEGYRVANWLAQHGIAAFVLKYRLQGDDGSSYTTEGHSLPDIQRAIRLVRSRSAEWGVDPNRVGDRKSTRLNS